LASKVHLSEFAFDTEVFAFDTMVFIFVTA